MSSLQLVGIEKYYGKNKILDAINLDIAKGEFIVVVGPSGCGKSTLLRMIAGLETISKGSIYIADKLVNQVEPKKRNVAMVFQNYALYPHMNVFKNMSFGLKIRKLPKDVIQQRVLDVANLLKISHLLERLPSELSGGQRQRVAMGRAIVRQPEVFLFDEPLSNLDAKLRAEMRLEIKKLQKSLNVTSFYVTHDQLEAMSMADKIVVLNKGVIEQFDTPSNVYHRPKTRFVADFMGANTVNFIDGEFLFQHINTYTTEAIKSDLKDKLPVKHIELAINCDEIFFDKQGVLKLHVELVEELGAGRFIHGQICNGPKVMMKCKENYKIKPNKILPVSINMNKVQYFSKLTGINLLENDGEY